MCGIAGFADSPAAEWAATPDGIAASCERVRQMCSVIRHRGPDDEGIHADAGVVLGMRRLSIIDLSTGHQPIHNEDRTIWVVFNGEIYNYRELRHELEHWGHRFYTTTDTEVIVHAYEQWGQDGIVRLRGMFALAISDGRTRSLLLARDRVGIKPLYYAERDGRLYFGSELKSLLAGGAVAAPALDHGALEHYLAFLYTPPDRAILQDVRKLPPAHLLRWHNGSARVVRYWEPPAFERAVADEAGEVDQLHAHLREAVRSHLMSDVPLGAFLSGGIDSGLVVGLMAEASSQPVRTFSIGFDEPAYDELDAARGVAQHFGTEHHEFVVRPDAVAIIDRLVHHFDEPFGDSSAIPTWYVSQLAAQHVKVVLSGDGGDELFGGYDRYLPHPRVAQFDRLRLPGAQGAAALAARMLPHGARGRRFLRHVSQSAEDRYIDTMSFYGPHDRDALLVPGHRTSGDPPEGALAAAFRGTEHLTFGSRMMRADFATYLPEDVLTKLDRMSMAHSLESRVPLLDNGVVDFALALPLHCKIRHGHRKRLLRAVAARVLPADVLRRPKHGFGVPLDVWFRGHLRELFGDVLGAPRARQRGYFQPAEVTRLLEEHLSGRRDHKWRLWQLLMFELWHRACLDTPIEAAPPRASRAVARSAAK